MSRRVRDSHSRVQLYVISYTVGKRHPKREILNYVPEIGKIEHIVKSTSGKREGGGCSNELKSLPGDILDNGEAVPLPSANICRSSLPKQTYGEVCVNFLQ